MGAIVLLLAAFIFIVDAAFLWGKADAKGAAASNILIGIPMMVIGLWLGFTSNGDAFAMILCSLALAFSLFYLIFGWSLLNGSELKGLGWYCLGPGLWTLLASLFFFTLGGDAILGVFAIIWAALFLAAWINLLWAHPVAAALTRWILAVGSIVTLMIPAYLLITGGWPPF